MCGSNRGFLGLVFLFALFGSLEAGRVDAQPTAARPAPASNEGCRSSAIAWQRRLIETFERWDDHGGGLGFSQSDNVLGVLANNEPQILEAYITMYEATRDAKYLIKAAAHGVSVLGHRDDFARRTDYSGHSNPVWSNRNPAYVRNDQLFPFSAESAWLSYPLAYFAYVVRREPALGEMEGPQGRRLGEIADWFVREVEKTIAYHNKDWHTDTTRRAPIGFYTTATDFRDAVGLRPGGIEPMNFQTSMGRLFVMMHLATSHRSYLVQARFLANFFLNDLSYSKDRDSYHWHYWPRAAYYKSWRQPHRNVEDVSHGGVSIDFMRLMYEHRLGSVGQPQMRRFANTFLKAIYRGRPGKFALTLNGQGVAGGRVRHLGYYAALSTTNRSIGTITRDNLEKLGLESTSAGSALMFVAIANQLKYLADPQDAARTAAGRAGLICS